MERGVKCNEARHQLTLPATVSVSETTYDRRRPSSSSSSASSVVDDRGDTAYNRGDTAWPEAEVCCLLLSIIAISAL